MTISRTLPFQNLIQHLKASDPRLYEALSRIGTVVSRKSGLSLDTIGDGKTYRRTSLDSINQFQSAHDNIGNSYENLLQNGGGQTGTVGSQSSYWTWDAGNALIIDNAFAKVGDRSMKCNNLTPIFSKSHQDVSISAGVVYEVSGWIKTTALPSADAGIGAGLTLTIVSGITSFTDIERVGVLSSTIGVPADDVAHDWTYVRYRFIGNGADGVVRLTISLGVTAAQSGCAWFDGITFKRMYSTDLTKSDVIGSLNLDTRITDGTIYGRTFLDNNAQNLISNPTMEIGGSDPVGTDGGWLVDVLGTGGSISWETVAPLVGSRSLKLVGSGSPYTSVISKPLFPVSSGEKYYVECLGKVNTSGFSYDSRVGLLYFDKNKAFLGIGDAFSFSTNTTATRKNAIMTPPANAIWARFWVLAGASIVSCLIDEAAIYRSVDSGIINPSAVLIDTHVADGSTYRRATLNEATGGGRGFNALDGSNRLTTRLQRSDGVASWSGTVSDVIDTITWVKRMTITANPIDSTNPITKTTTVAHGLGFVPGVLAAVVDGSTYKPISGRVPVLYTGQIQADIFSSTTIGKSNQTWSPDFFKDWFVRITAGTGAGQNKGVSGNTATTITIVGFGWATTPDSTSFFTLMDSGSASVQAIYADSTNIYVINSSDTSLTIKVYLFKDTFNF